MAPGVISGAFNGVKYIFTQVGLTQGLEITSFVSLLLLTLGFTIVFGRFFCGYACAFGSLGDIVYDFFEFIRSKTPIRRIVFPRPLVRVLSLLKYVILIAIVYACARGVWSDVSSMSPWVSFAALTSTSWAIAWQEVSHISFLLLAILLVFMIIRKRFFCQFLCPLGATFTLMPIFNFSNFTRKKHHCAKGCSACIDSCPVDIWPDSDELSHAECVLCGKCAEVCPMNNVNFVALEKNVAQQERLEREAQKATESQDTSVGKTNKRELMLASKPLRKTRKTWHLIRGSETAVVVLKAFLFFMGCWALGAVRYVPDFQIVLDLFM
ncbi:MAG: 4Fe-4S binding protein [Eggerthellaceae bacterium]|nr:4Fe-4S binding protein [Eggerthellaceae bacterium]